MQEVSFEEGLERIRAKDSRYDRDAYEFVRDALDHTRKIGGKEGRGQHVTGQELLNGIRDLALSKFGPMAITVFEEWGIRTCPDFGEIVFNMIEAELLAKRRKTPAATLKVAMTFATPSASPSCLPANCLPRLSRNRRPRVCNSVGPVIPFCSFISSRFNVLTFLTILTIACLHILKTMAPPSPPSLPASN